MFDLSPYRLDLISDGFFELDVSTQIQSGETKESPSSAIHYKQSIRTGFNSLLVRGSGHTILIDPGTGDKPRPDKVEQYRMEWPRKLFPALHELGVLPDEVDTVVLTHLHWDHCGGATRYNKHGKLVPTFTNAKYYLQKSELDSALEKGDSDPDSYLIDDYMPLLDSNVLEIVDGESEILPGIELRWVGGHSAGLQIVVIGKIGEPRSVFLSDLIPSTAQIPIDKVMSFDENVDELRAAKQKILDEAAANNYLLLFVHAPRNRAGYILKDPKHGYMFRSIEI